MCNSLHLENVRDEVFNAYNELSDKVSNMSFDEAFKAFNGFNLDADPYYDNVRECIVPCLKYEIRYRNIEATIFQCGNNRCELWETAVYKLDKDCEIVFDIAAHHSIRVYSIITSDNVVFMENWTEKTK